MTRGATSVPAYKWQLLVLAAPAAVFDLLLLTLPASAAAAPAAGTRVGALTPADDVAVGVHECVTVGHRPVRGPSQPQTPAGSGVAAEAADDVADVGHAGRHQFPGTLPRKTQFIL